MHLFVNIILKDIFKIQCKHIRGISKSSVFVITTVIYKIDRAVSCIIVVVGTVGLHLEKMQCWEGMRISVNFTFLPVCLFFWAYITRLIPTLGIEVFVPRLEGERSCIYVLGILILTLTTIFLSDFWTVPTVCEVFCCCCHTWFTITMQGRIQGGGGRTPRAPPLKLENIWFFGIKSWFFIRNAQTNFAPPSARRNFFKCAPPNLKSWIRPCNGLSLLHEAVDFKGLVLGYGV